MTEQTENRMLQNILLDAAASEFSEELSDSQPVVMSLRFQKQMEAMLKDPNGWAKRRERPIWKRFLQTVASIVLVCSLSLGALMAASPTVRAAVVNWMLKWYETYVVYRFFEEPVEDQLLPMPEYQITKLPNGYSEDGDLLELPNDTEIKYRNNHIFCAGHQCSALMHPHVLKMNSFPRLVSVLYFCIIWQFNQIAVFTVSIR